MSNEDNKWEKEKLLWKHSWKYFELHANQRILLFRFYIGLFAFLLATAGFVWIRFRNGDIFAELAAIFISIIFAIITVIFHLLDRRNRQLIHYAEDALRDIEPRYFTNVNDKQVNVFTKERNDICNGKNCLRHTHCFLVIYITAYIASGLLFLASIIYLFCLGKPS